MNLIPSITYSVLISYCFALHPYEKRELIKPEWVIEKDFSFCQSTQLKETSFWYKKWPLFRKEVKKNIAVMQRPIYVQHSPYKDI